jgi:hypothetical protein
VGAGARLPSRDTFLVEAGARLPSKGASLAEMGGRLPWMDACLDAARTRLVSRPASLEGASGHAFAGRVLEPGGSAAGTVSHLSSTIFAPRFQKRELARLNPQKARRADPHRPGPGRDLKGDSRGDDDPRMVRGPAMPLDFGKEKIVMSGNTVTKLTLAKRALDLVAGTQKHSPNGSFTLGSATYTAANLVQLFQGLADAIANVDLAKAGWQDALKSMGDAHAKAVPVLRAYQSWLAATYGNAPATLADYGLAPRKVPTPPSADAKAAAVAKREATRQARHTMGKKQKLKVTGTVPQAVSAPATPASAPIAPSPVASAPAGTSAGTAPRVA